MRETGRGFAVLAVCVVTGALPARIHAQPEGGEDPAPLTQAAPDPLDPQDLLLQEDPLETADPAATPAATPDIRPDPAAAPPLAEPAATPPAAPPPTPAPSPPPDRLDATDAPQTAVVSPPVDHAALVFDQDALGVAAHAALAGLGVVACWALPLAALVALCGGVAALPAFSVPLLWPVSVWAPWCVAGALAPLGLVISGASAAVGTVIMQFAGTRRGPLAMAVGAGLLGVLAPGLLVSAVPLSVALSLTLVGIGWAVPTLLASLQGKQVTPTAGAVAQTYVAAAALHPLFAAGWTLFAGSITAAVVGTAAAVAFYRAGRRQDAGEDGALDVLSVGPRPPHPNPQPPASPTPAPQ